MFHLFACFPIIVVAKNIDSKLSISVRTGNCVNAKKKLLRQLFCITFYVEET